MGKSIVSVEHFGKSVRSKFAVLKVLVRRTQILPIKVLVPICSVDTSNDVVFEGRLSISSLVELEIVKL